LDALTTDYAASQPGAGAGRMDEAKAAVAEARRLSPKLTVKWYFVHYTPPRPWSTAFATGGGATPPSGG